MLPTTDNRFYLEEISSRSSPVPRAPFGRLRGIASKGQTGSTFENPTDGPEDGVHFIGRPIPSLGGTSWSNIRDGVQET